jgi:hypothetical protein
MMRAATVVATAVLVMVSGAGADVSRVTGPAHGTVTRGPRQSCPDYPMSLSGTVATAHGPAKLSVLVCYDYDGGYEVTGGDFAIRQGEGHARGWLTGVENPGHNSLDFEYTLTVKNRTASFPPSGTKLDFSGSITYSDTTGHWRGRVASK